jgi:aminoglycoside phosphotransferase (APT) family kinase protein
MNWNKGIAQGVRFSMARTKKIDDFQQRLAEYLAAVTKQEVEIETLQPFVGASRESWLVKAEIGDADQQFVLRIDPLMPLADKSLERDQEFRVMKAVHDVGVLMPRPRWYCLEPVILGAPFYITDFVDGIAAPKDVVGKSDLADARKALPTQMGEQLAKIHAIDPASLKLDFLPRPRAGFSPAQETIAQLRGVILKLNLHNPTFEFGLRWLEQNAPKTEKPTLLHGDFRVGNLLVNSKGLSGILDWELARMGDPLEDLAWPCVREWRHGKGDLQLGGVSKREPFIKAYELASKRTVDRKQVDYWEILGNLRQAVIYLSQANKPNPGLDVAVLGRRSAEMQLEMLRLIGAQGLKDNV